LVGLKVEGKKEGEKLLLLTSERKEKGTRRGGKRKYFAYFTPAEKKERVTLGEGKGRKKIGGVFLPPKGEEEKRKYLFERKSLGTLF